MSDPVTLAGCSEEKESIGQAQGQEAPCQLKKVSQSPERGCEGTSPQHMHSYKLNYGYFSHTAAPTGDKESQTDLDWIHYYAQMGGGVESRG